VALLAELGVALGGGEAQLRLASALAGLAVVPAIYAVGRAVFDARTGAWAAAVLAGVYPMVARSAELLGDLPATACVLAGIAVLVGELDREAGPRRRLVLAAPAFAAAFYLRYASAPVIAIAGLAALILWWRQIRRHAGLVLATAALFAALFVPHAIHSFAATGDLLGVLRHSSGVPRRAYFGEGLVTYLTSNPFLFYGALMPPVFVAAIVGLARCRRRAPWLLAVVAAGQVIALGLESHGQPRYVYVATALVVVLGVAPLRRVDRTAPPSGGADGRGAPTVARPRLALALVAAAWLGAAIATFAVHRVTAHNRAVITAAVATIRQHRARPACAVIAGTGPQLAWYSGCHAIPPIWDDPARFDPQLDRFVVSTPYLRMDGPTYAAANRLTASELPTGDPRTRVWRLQ